MSGEKIKFYLISFFLILLPFGNILPQWLIAQVPILGRLLSVVIILLSVHWIYSLFVNPPKISRKRLVTISILISFYLIHILGLFFTENEVEGLKDIEVKSSLLIFPLLLGVSNGFDRHHFFKAIMFFIYSCLVSFFICLAGAFYDGALHDSSELFYIQFSRFIHPAYFSMYVCFAFFSSVYLYFKPEQHFRRFQFLPIISLLGIAHFFIASKAGILIFILGLLVLLFLTAFRYKKIKLAVTCLLAIIMAGVLALKTITPLKERFTAMISAMADDSDVHTRESSAIRKIIWGEAVNIIKENPLGAGTGDVKDELLKAYEKKDITLGKEKKLNAHNEYLQILLAVGIPGLVVFLISIAAAIKYSKPKTFVLYTIFLFIVLLNFLTESMLETQAGVLFFAFFNSFLIFGIRDEALKS